MPKKSYNTIPDLATNWFLDPTLGYPYAGQSVQAFIKSYLRNISAAAWFNPTNMILYFFASEEDRATFIADNSRVDLITFSCPFNFNSTMYRVNITNYYGETTINVATNSEHLSLATSFMVQSKGIADQNWHDEDGIACYVTIYIDKGATGQYVPLTERILYNPGVVIARDVFEDLDLGINRIKFTYEAEDGTVTQSLVYTVTLSELYVELFNNSWFSPILGSDSATWMLGGYRIAGSGSKTLHLSFYNGAGTCVIDDIQIFIGTTNAYATTPYFYRFDSSSPIAVLTTGVYRIRAWVTTPTLESEYIEYNTMFVAASDVSTAKLICINDVAEAAPNYSSVALCKYSIYNGGASYADLTVRYQQMNGSAVVSTVTRTLSDIPTSSQQELSYEVLWPGIEGSGYFLSFTMTLDAVSAGSTIPIDNSTVFPPTPGYDFYTLASNRSNGESASSREKFVNVANDTELAAVWNDVDFINNVDGWTVDDEGRACLRIPAGTKVTLPYTSFNMFRGDNFTLELDYKIANVSDYSENVITIATNPTEAGFAGLRIRPTGITVHSLADTTDSNDLFQGKEICDNEEVHFVLSVNPYYSGNHKLVKAYINGCKNFEFAYDYGTDWNIPANLVIGSERSDVFIYFIRRYPVALSDAAVQANYVNACPGITARRELHDKIASVMDSGETNVDYESVKNNGYNFFVINMTSGSGVPSKANNWGKDTKGVSSLEMHFGQHPEWDWKLTGVETTGQGTTSMNYYRWNIRWRIDKSNDDKKVPVAYLVSRTRIGDSFVYEWGDASQSKTVNFDGDNHPAVMRITAKINQASSMQSHKMGATRAYTELHDAIGLRNEAQEIADDGGTPRPVVAVYQYPAFGFEYDANTNTYTFIGLFTIGPDKGDKPTFGFDTVKNSLISLEGTDHNQPIAKFSYPWDENVDFFASEEGVSIDLGAGSYLTGLEVGNCHGKSTDEVEDQGDIRTILNTELKPAYNFVFEHSTLIFPIALDDVTYGGADASAVVANINADITNFRDTAYNSRLSYADMQFWVEDDYTLYYYDPVTGVFKAGTDLSVQFPGLPSGLTLDEQNEWFKEQRRASFMDGVASYWNLDEAIYHYVFCLMLGASDNFAKNAYPYKMKELSLGGRYGWRQDDLDTLFDIDNSGRDSKPYQIEYGDATSNTPYFAGSNSVFWNLINECYWDDYNSGIGKGIRTMAREMIAAMTRLSSSNNPYDGFVNYISDVFWGNAQDYFPVSAYNVDAEFKYEQAWLVNGQDVPPLTQSLGNHYSSERLWVMRRAIYTLSLFGVGPFGDYSDSRLGTISFRPNSLTVSLTPLMWLYPALCVGQATVVRGGRTQPGGTAILTQSSDGNTAFYIQGTNYLTSLGNFKSVVLGLQDIGNITITGAKLREFIIGDEVASNVTTNIPGLVFNNTACIETIDARNAVSITSVTGLDKCIRLRELLLSGTSLTNVTIPEGSKIETLTLPAGIQRLVLRNMKHLSTLDADSYAAVVDLVLEELTNIDAFGFLQEVVENSLVLSRVRVLWTGTHVDITGNAMAAIASLAKSNISGITSDGQTRAKPFVEGTLDVTSNEINSRDLELMDIVSEETVGSYKKALCNVFDTVFYIVYDPAKVHQMYHVVTSDDYTVKTSDGYQVYVY